MAEGLTFNTTEQVLFTWLLSRRFGLPYPVIINPRRRRRMWVHPLLRQRLTRGHFHRLYSSLREHPEKFYQYCRMSISTFDRLLETVRPGITFQDTRMRKAISAEERLLLTIRSLNIRPFHGRIIIAVVGIGSSVSSICQVVHQRHFGTKGVSTNTWSFQDVPGDLTSVDKVYYGGIFFYNGHPIRQVDILGTVVSVREKDAFYSYGVDDSTGVINCTCWKSSGQKCTSSSEDQKSPSEAKDLDGIMQELYRHESRKAKMEIGDVIRVRGYVKVFRNQREVVASTFYKVDDPTLDVQITRMLDLPHLYRNVYDKPFVVPDQLTDPSHGLLHEDVLSHSGLILQLSEKIKEFLDENQTSNFYQRELESVPSLLSTATKPSQKAEEGSSATSKEIHNVFKEAIHLLLEKGLVYLKGHQTHVYQVTDQDNELHKLALSIIQEDCRRQRHADKGCHFLHILNCMRQTFGSCINQTILQRVIDGLERNSDIISTMEKYYTSFL